MFCPKCGMEIDDKAKRCPQCGVKVKKKSKKKIIIGVVVLICLIGIFGQCGKKSDDSSKDSNSKTSIAENTKENNSSVDTKEKNNEESSEEKKQQTKSNDLIIYTTAEMAERYYNILVEDMAGLETGESTLLDVYSTCEDLKEYMPKYSDHLDEVEDDTAKDYIKAVNNYVWNIYTISDNLIEYINENKMSALSDAKDGISLSSTYALKVVSERTNYLSQAGFTTDEIIEIMDVKSDNEA